MRKIFLALACIAATATAAFAADPVKRTTPDYDKAENVIEAIVAQYPGQTVFVDLWATWCGPCIRAMETIKPIKPWMEQNGIIKVYVTNPTSDMAKWEEMIKDIGGEQYVLTQDEWKAACDKFGIKGIPTYMVYDKNGEQTYQISGYPGNEVMQGEMTKAL